jgi:8-oxo-dGTP diphosphatase
MSATIVRAAGGVVYRDPDNGGLQVALVHRPAYDDWTFPKGKLKPDEREEEAALREVEEETGLRCRLEQELAGVSYRDKKGRPKIVRYWVMRPLSGSFEPNDEVDQFEWLPLDTALERLTYEHDRLLLRMFDANGGRRGQAPVLPPDSTTVPLYVIRHAKAGDRTEWTELDELRPLDEPGFLQAEALVDLFDGFPIERVISSPSVRCIQTVELLARTRGIDVEMDDRLAEGAPIESTLELFDKVDRPTVICSHGDVIGNLLEHLTHEGVVEDEDRGKMKKGSTWVVDLEDLRPVRAHYLPPPA